MDDPASSSNQVPKSGYVPVRSDRLSVDGSQPYSKSRASNHSGFVWGDALSTQSMEDVDDALSLLVAEISSRIYPSPTSVITEDSPVQEKSVSGQKRTSLASLETRADSVSVVNAQSNLPTVTPQHNWPVRTANNTTLPIIDENAKIRVLRLIK